MIPRPYLAIDTEFSGVDDKDQAELFEVAMILEDFTRPVNQLPYFWAMVSRKSSVTGEWKPLTYAEPYALLVNFENGLLRDIVNNKPRTVEQDGIQYEIGMFELEETIKLMAQFSDFCTKHIQERHPEIKKLQLGGKNVETDLRVIEGNARRASLNHKIISNRFDYKTMDPGKMAANSFGYTPGSDELNALYDFGPQPHRAFFDALNVVKTIRKQFNISL